MLSSQSLIGLFKMLKTVCNIDYIMTQKLNQDCLEHFFGCVRHISGPYEHPNAVSFKQRLRTLLLGKDISVVSSKSNITTEKVDKATYVSGCHTARDTHERELAIEVCLTTLVFKDMDFYIEGDDISDVKIQEAPEVVIEEESLRYIGGYIVKKFSKKYPQLGSSVSNNNEGKSWIDFVSVKQLHVPSDEFLSQLKIMREIFKAVHGNSLKEGKKCVQTLCSDFGKAGVNIPADVQHFFARISIFFKIRSLNGLLAIEKTRNQENREISRKKVKLNITGGR